MIDLERLGEALKTTRKKRKLTQFDVIDQLRDKGIAVSPIILSHWEHGKRIVNIKNLFALSEIYFGDNAAEGALIMIKYATDTSLSKER